MPELRQRRRELFARFLADGNSQAESYELSGYAPSTANASTLANNPEVRARVAELKEEKMQAKAQLESRLAELGHKPGDEPSDEVFEVVKWTVEKVQHELFLNARLAQAAGQFVAANKSLELLGQSVGMWENSKPGNNNGKGPAQVSLAFVQQTVERLENQSGGEPAEALSPLAPRVRDASRT